MESYLTRTSSSSSSGDAYISMEVDEGGFHYRHHHYRRHRSSSAKEFEFQSFSSSSDADRSPADELFYMGKLLPLHLPPRLQMVHTILSQNDAVELFSTPAANTPYQSCNISPSDSCHVSTELNPADYFRDYAPISNPEMKTVVKRDGSGGKGFGSKLNWRYFKSLFSKSSGCSSQYSSAAADGKIRPITRSEKQCGNGKTAQFGEIRYKKGSNDPPEGDRRGGGRGSHRRSFSGAFKRLSEAKKYSDSSSTMGSDSQASNYREILKRSSSSRWSPETENPIQAAIAHCKRSQLCSKPLTAAATVCGDGMNRTGICRG